MTSVEVLRLGTAADRRRRLAFASADAAHRAVDLSGALAAGNDAGAEAALDRLEAAVRAVRDCMADLADAPGDAEVEAYRADLRSPHFWERRVTDRRLATTDRRQTAA